MTDPIRSPLRSARRYTTASFVVLAVFYVPLALVQSREPLLLVSGAVAGAATIAMTFFWERPAPVWLTVPAVAAVLTSTALAAAHGQNPMVTLLSGFVLALVASYPHPRAWLWRALALIPLLLPVLIAIPFAPDGRAVPHVFSSLFAYAGSLAALLLNRWAFGLYLQLDAAQRTAGDLAVAQERFRFAADLHDIQGHTLHVVRLKARLASKLVDRDPERARQQLDEVLQLVDEAIESTRSLAFGDRTVTLAGELANARQLFEAAGIRSTVDGTPAPQGPADELLGLVVREATTNILRHAQATSVDLTVGQRSVRIVNDGASESPRSPRGLARLAQRLEQAGGRLTTRSEGGAFITEAVIG